VSQPECLTIAGFYRILNRAGDAYLDADEVMEKWNAESYEGDSSVIRPNLAQLKAQAKNCCVACSLDATVGGGGEGGVAVPYVRGSG